MYKYMEYYDDGKYEKIPVNILGYFNGLESADAGDHDTVLISTLDARLNELETKIKDVDERIFQAKVQKQALSAKIFGRYGKGALPIESNERKAAESDYETILAKINEDSVDLERMKVDYDNLQKERASVTSHIGRRIIDLKLRSRDFNAYSYYDGTRCMVLTDCERAEDEDVILSLYAKMNGRYQYLKSYRQRKGEYFFMIDDVVFSAPLYYEVERVCDYGQNEWEYEVIASSGMQRLIIENKENNKE